MKTKLLLLLAILSFGFSNAQIVNIPNTNFKARLLLASTTQTIAYNSVGVRMKIDTNSDGEIQVSEALLVYQLNVPTQNIADVTGIESFTNLRSFNCINNTITTLNVNGLTNLTTLSCSGNQLTILNISNLTNLITLSCSNNQLTSLNVSNSPNMTTLTCKSNQLTSLILSNLTNLITVDCSTNALTSLDVSNNTNLTSLKCHVNQLTNLNISNCFALAVLYCYFNQLTNLDISNRPNLIDLECNDNSLTSLNITNDLALIVLYIGDNQLTNINLDAFINITDLALGENPYSAPVNISTLVNLQIMYAENITNPAVFPLTNSVMPLLVNLTTLKTDNSNIGNLNYSLIPNLETLLCRYTGLTNINNIPTDLITFVCEGNALTSLNMSSFTNLQLLNCYNNQITSLTFGNQPALYSIAAGDNNIPNIDFSTLSQLTQLNLSYSPNLISFNIKNGATTSAIFLSCPNLQYICADEAEIPTLQNQITTYNYTNCHVNTYCSFVPGGTYYTIQGTSRFDANSNGCDATDNPIPHMKFSFITGTTTGNIIADISGSYRNDVQAGTHNFTPLLENPTYFNISPLTASVTFPPTTSPFMQNFCIAPNGSHNDLEVAILPINSARPGFNANYEIVYKNKGTQPQSGSVNLAFYDAAIDYVSAIPSASNQTTNNLIWNFSNLLPFETRTIKVDLNLNSQTETPALNSGDILTYTATVNGATDEIPNDNTSIMSQTVVNAVDPNDKTCVEGAIVSPSMVGQYMHYIIRFQNDGTANAQNIVIRDIIDVNKFDITTLIPMSASADFITRFIGTNKVEFIFQNINLPFNVGFNTGYITFKIKTKSTLVVGDSFSNSANIYFDYNFPIVTNNFTTTVQTLGVNQAFANSNVSIFPNPVKDIINFNTQDIVIKVEVYDIAGRILSSNSVNNNKLNLSDLQTGNYILKVYTESGITNTKIIKE